jgi:hypothetical protein
MRDGVQSMKRIHVGLGPNTLAKRVKVKWPSGAVTEVADLQADRIHTLREDPTCSHDRLYVSDQTSAVEFDGR